MSCSNGEHDPYGVFHQWEHRPGMPLTCYACGDYWPGAAFPEYVRRVEGNHHDEIVASGMWSVRDMINAMKAMDV